MSTGRTFHKAGLDIQKALDPVLVLIQRTTNLWSVDILSISTEQEANVIILE